MQTVPDALQAVLDHIDAMCGEMDTIGDRNKIRCLRQRIIEQRAQACNEVTEKRMESVKP